MQFSLVETVWKRCEIGLDKLCVLIPIFVTVQTLAVYNPIHPHNLHTSVHNSYSRFYSLHYLCSLFTYPRFTQALLLLERNKIFN